MTVDALAEKVATLERAVLTLRFQIECQQTDAAPTRTTLKVAQFAGHIGRTPAWVRRECAAGRIKAFGPPYLIPASEMHRFI